MTYKEEIITNKVLPNWEYAPSSQSGYLPEFQKFDNNQELIFSGCSQTNGEHISLPLTQDGDCTKIWGFQVANHFKLSSVNLGLCGESIYNIVRKLMAHFSEYGNPKILLCLFPDPYRLTLPRDEDLLVAKSTSSEKKIIETSYAKHPEDKFPRYSKRPHYKENVISEQTPVWLNMQSILFLEQYCRSSGIKFYYSSWDKDTQSMFANYKNSIYIEDNTFTNCHYDLKQEFPNLFYYGIDGKHMGIHQHTHIAESFIKEMIKDGI